MDDLYFLQVFLPPKYELKGLFSVQFKEKYFVIYTEKINTNYLNKIA